MKIFTRFLGKNGLRLRSKDISRGIIWKAIDKLTFQGQDYKGNKYIESWGTAQFKCSRRN